MADINKLGFTINSGIHQSYIDLRMTEHDYTERLRPLMTIFRNSEGRRIDIVMIDDIHIAFSVYFINTKSVVLFKGLGHECRHGYSQLTFANPLLLTANGKEKITIPFLQSSPIKDASNLISAVDVDTNNNEKMVSLLVDIFSESLYQLDESDSIESRIMDRCVCLGA